MTDKKNELPNDDCTPKEIFLLDGGGRMLFLKRMRQLKNKRQAKIRLQFPVSETLPVEVVQLILDYVMDIPFECDVDLYFTAEKHVCLQCCSGWQRFGTTSGWDYHY